MTIFHWAALALSLGVCGLIAAAILIVAHGSGGSSVIAGPLIVAAIIVVILGLVLLAVGVLESMDGLFRR